MVLFSSFNTAPSRDKRMRLGGLFVAKVYSNYPIRSRMILPCTLPF
jgi:hypothetical protein